jgi:hypothetical protein
MEFKTHPAFLSDEELLRECEIQFLRRGGPGGQHRNKTESAVIFLHKPSKLTAEANERRSQADNRRLALVRLRLSLALNIRSAGVLGDQPSELWLSKCHNQRIRVATDHPDFPALLAELLDCCTAHAMELPAVVAHLNVSSSQVVRMLKQYPAAWALFNQKRLEHGLPGLR